MSDDLISRKAVLELLFKDGEWCCDVSKIYERVENLTTAFDKEKVIEELLSESICARVGEEAFIRLDRSVEIIKKGGIE